MNLQALSKEILTRKLSLRYALKLTTPLISPYEDASQALRLSSIRPHLDRFLYVFFKGCYRTKNVSHVSFEDVNRIQMKLDGVNTLSKLKPSGSDQYSYISEDSQLYIYQGDRASLRLSLSNIPYKPKNEFSTNEEYDKHKRLLSKAFDLGVSLFFYSYNAGVAKSKGFGQLELAINGPNGYRAFHGNPKIKSFPSIIAGLETAATISFFIGFIRQVLAKEYAEKKLSEEDFLTLVAKCIAKEEDAMNEIVAMANKVTFSFSILSVPVAREVISRSIEWDRGINSPKFLTNFLRQVLPQLKPDLTHLGVETARKMRLEPRDASPSLLRQYLADSESQKDDIKPLLINNGYEIITSTNNRYYGQGYENSYHEAYANQRSRSINDVLFFKALLGLPETLDFMISNRRNQGAHSPVKVTYKFESSAVEQLQAGIQYKRIDGKAYAIAFPFEHYIDLLSPEDRSVRVSGEIVYRGVKQQVRNLAEEVVDLPTSSQFRTGDFLQWLSENRYL